MKWKMIQTFMLKNIHKCLYVKTHLIDQLMSIEFKW